MIKAYNLVCELEKHNIDKKKEKKGELDLGKNVTGSHFSYEIKCLPNVGV